MMVTLTFDSVRQNRWHDYAVRFLFGGAITLFAGIIASRFGPALGGLFLAFPAIFPATGTLIEKREKETKERKGLHGERRGRFAAGADAAGSAIGSLALLVFAVLVWQFLPRAWPWIVLALAVPAWFIIAVGAWMIFRRKLWRF